LYLNAEAIQAIKETPKAKATDSDPGRKLTVYKKLANLKKPTKTLIQKIAMVFARGDAQASPGASMGVQASSRDA